MQPKQILDCKLPHQIDLFDSDLFLEDPSATESSEDVESFDAALLHDTVVSGTDWTTETIVSQISKNNIVLDPKFQRREAWTQKRKSAFIESIILGFPIPPIVLAESLDQRGKYIVIDGKQRLLSIRQFWSIGGQTDFTKLSLRNLEILEYLEGYDMEKMSIDPESQSFLSAFENQSIRTIVIKNWKEESILYHIFLRLNTGSVPLSPQELRQALHPGPFVDFVDESSTRSSALKSILGLDAPDFRMRDVELLVRYFAFRNYLPMYRGSLKSFLDDTCKFLNRDWSDHRVRIEDQLEEFEEAYLAATEIFGLDSVFRKWDGSKYVSRFNRAVYDFVMYYFSFSRIRNASMEHPEALREEFKKLCEKDADFLASIERTTKSIEATHLRFSKWGQALQRHIGIRVPVPHVAEEGNIWF